MKGELYSPGQPIKKEDLNYEKYSLQDSMSERILDLYTPGVLSGSQELSETIPFQITSGGGLFINVGSGAAIAEGAIDSSDSTKTGGERIYIPAAEAVSGQNYVRSTGGGPGSGTGTGPFAESADGLGGYVPTPKSTLTRLIPVTDATTNYVWIGYLHAIDPSVYSLHKATSGKIYPRGKDGYDIIVTTSPSTPVFNGNPNYRLLGTVLTAGGLVITIDQSAMVLAKTRGHRVGVTIDSAASPATYSDGQTKFLEDHINALGTGATISSGNPHRMSVADMGLVFEDIDLVGHRKNHHSKGIIGSALATGSSLKPGTSNSTPVLSELAMVYLKQLSSGEELVLLGSRYTEVFPKLQSPFVPAGPDAIGDAYVSFAAGSPGTYYLYINIVLGVATFQKSLVVPTASQYLIGTVDWDGAAFTALSLVDSRLFGLTGNKDIQAGAITLEKMAPLSVGTANIVAASVTNPKMATDSVDTANIINAAVTNPKLSTNAVGTGNLQDGSVTAAKLAIGAIPPSSPAIRFYIQGDLAVNNPPPSPGPEDPRCIAAVMVEKDMTIARIHMQVDHAPSGGPIIMNLRYLGPTNTQPQWNAVALFPFVPPTIQAGNTRNGGALLYEDSSNNTDILNGILLEAGGRLYLDITSIGTTSPGGDDTLITIVGV